MTVYQVVQRIIEVEREHAGQYADPLEAVKERYKATAAAYRGPMDTGFRLDRKGATLLLKRGE